MVRAFASRRAGGGMVGTRPALPFRHAPTGNVIIIERRPVFFVNPFFFRHRLFIFGQPFFFRQRFFSFGQPLFLGGPPVDVIDAPFFCNVDGLAFTDRATFAQHLHDAHGVPLDEALSDSVLVDGRYVFFGS
jgi:hypothetical protein